MNSTSVYRSLAKAAVAALLVGCIFIGRRTTGQNPASASQGKPLPSSGQVLKVNVEVVNVYAVVTDKKRLIPDLNKQDFDLTEDNAPQDIKYFSRQSDTPLTLAIAVDTSGSEQRVLPLEQEQAVAF